MKVFVFDLLPYATHLDHLRVDGELPYPLGAAHCDPKVVARTYAEHLDAWEEMDRLGYDGVGFNEHHTSPYGLMNSPNLLAAAAAQRTKNIKLLIYANLLPLHNPLRLAEELAMLDCMSNGRIISGFARGIPREYAVHNVPMSESRERFEEAYEIVTRAWSEDIFSYEGKFWSHKDIAIWPRPYQQPGPPVWIPVTGSRESIEWAAARNIPITPGAATEGLRLDAVRLYAQSLAQHGRTITPDHISLPANVFVADSKAEAVRQNAPYHLYFNTTIYSHGNFTETSKQRGSGYVSERASDYVSQENLKAFERSRDDFRKLTFADVEKQAQNMPWGSPDEVTQRLIDAAERAGAGTLLLSMNRGAMPQELFLEQIRRFGRDVLPALQAYQVKSSPFAAQAAAE
ncbi:MAG: Alkanesulfonate monooxygenase SsuD/methylene tetrahydromethanopterin reductase-like [Hyphomicrobiales bacterium]|nr:Alkanesulfonate monooxygenase SsuD/methylene tetrahydromethanopterin reductase-like [Hyphomicrobiales bacterium]